jgi:hypothetical protein
VGPTAIYRHFAKLPLTILGAHGVHFSIRLQPRDQHPVIYITAVPGPLFILSPRGTFFIHGQVHMPIFHAYQIHAHIFNSLQILFTLGIWFSCVQVPYHHPSTQPLQVYTRHRHVVFPAVSHLHFQSHPLILASRIPIPDSAVPTPPFASSVLLPRSILTHMSCPIHSTFCHFLTLLLFFITL